MVNPFELSRRAFLYGASALATFATRSQNADAREAGKFNGGRSQIQTWSPSYGGDFPFLNCMKAGSGWSYGGGPNANAAVDPSILNSDGYPRIDPPGGGGVYTVFNVPSQKERPGRYVITWKGNGTVGLNMNQTNPSGSKTSVNGFGRYEFDTNSSRFDVRIGAGFSNVRVFHVDDEAALNRGEVFGARFKSLLRQANCGVFRFLDWQNGNGSNVTTWATRKPVNYAFYAGAEYRAEFYAGVTTNSGNDYELSFGSGPPRDKQVVHLRFNTSASADTAPVTITQSASPATVEYEGHPFSGGELVCFSGKYPQGMFAENYFVQSTERNTFKISTSRAGVPIATSGGGANSLTLVRPPTLNLNGTGAIPIKSPWGDPLDRSSQPRAKDGLGKDIYSTLVYDEDLNCWLKFGRDLSSGLANGIPPEICLQLCAELGMHPYFVTPYLTIDPPTDYMSSLAKYCKDNAPSWMVPRFESCNETWNFAGGFYATRYGWNKAFHSWRTQYDQNNWYGKTVSILGQAVSRVYSNDRTKYQVLCGVQSVSGHTAASVNTNNSRLTAARFVSSGGSPAHEWVTHICCAQYISPAQRGTPQELIYAFNYAVTHASYPTMQESIVRSYVDTLLGPEATFNLAYNNAIYANLKAWAAKWGVQKMCGYEGGYSPDYNGADWSFSISSATQSTQCVLSTMGTTNSPEKGRIAGNAAVIGMRIIIAGVNGMAELNGRMATILAVSNNDITIDIDSSKFGIYVSGGTATYIKSGSYINNLRAAGKYAPNLRDHTLTNYNNFLAAGGEFPSCYMLAGSKSAWSIFDPDIYAPPSSQWAAIVAFNHEKN